jgi:flagellar hook-associated protein 2
MSTTSGINVISSSIDVGAIVDALITNESAPITLMQKQTSTLQSKITALQGINTKLSTLLGKVDGLLYSGDTVPLLFPNDYGDRFENSVFSERKVTSSNESAITATASKGTVSGAYAITVDNLASSESLGSANFADTITTKTGTGTLVFQVGPAGQSDPVTITIDDTNNTLDGIRKAINSKKAGFTATIINDGTATPYRLLITSDKSGTANAVSLQDNLTGGQALAMTETVQATDAKFQVNGVSIQKSSNTVSDVIEGISFTLHDTGATPVNLTVVQDSDKIVSALNDLATAYNDVNSTISAQSGYNATTKTAGILSGDSTVRSVRDKIQSILAQTVRNDYTSFAVISQVGLTFNNDGSISLNQSKLRDAVDKDVTSVAALFLGDGATTDGRVSVTSQTSDTKPGVYGVQVDSLAQQASVKGSTAATTLTQDEALTVTVNGVVVPVSLLNGDDPSALVSKINQAMNAQGVAATASLDDAGNLQVNSNDFGSSQTLSLISSLAAGNGTSGVGNLLLAASGLDIAGRINGDVAAGSGLTLTGTSGDETGLTLKISQTTTGSYGTVSVSDGYTSTEGSSPLVNLHSALKSITDPLTGPIHNTTDAYNSSIRDLNNRISEYQDRLEIRRQMLTAEYSAADDALRMLTVSQTSLSNQTASLSKL